MALLTFVHFPEVVLHPYCLLSGPVQSCQPPDGDPQAVMSPIV